jgi:flagellar hook assembly protein FlgD
VNLGPSGSDDPETPGLTAVLRQNYPNPFNPTTTLSFNMHKAGNAKLSVYNVKGQLVKTLLNSTIAAGSNSVDWNGDDNSGKSVTSGIYFYKLTANGKTETKKMMLMK